MNLTPLHYNRKCPHRDSQVELVQLGTEKSYFSCANPRVRSPKAR